MFLTLHDVRKRTDKELFAFVPEPDAKKQGSRWQSTRWTGGY